MPPDIVPWLGDLNARIPQFWMTPIISVAAILCGAIIGWERQRAEKPAGLRTLILISLGAAIFTHAGIILAGPAGAGERGRVAAQIVTGIGFLGAGAIIRDRGQIMGITTGAGIWATAAVGMVIGAGHVVSGFFFTLLVVATLAASGKIEVIAEGPCQFVRLRIVFDPDHGKTRIKIEHLLEDFLRNKLASYEEPPGEPGVGILRYCRAHREHHVFLADLMEFKEVRQVEMI